MTQATRWTSTYPEERSRTYLVPTPSRRHPSAAPITEISIAIVAEITEGRADVTNMLETAVTIASPSVIAGGDGRYHDTRRSSTDQRDRRTGGRRAEQLA